MVRKVYKGLFTYLLMKKKRGIKIKCTNPKCNHIWIYRGNNPFYAQCPICMRKINIKKNRIRKNEQKGKI